MPYAFLDRLERTWGLHTLGFRLVVGYALIFVLSITLLAVLTYVLFNRFMHEPDRAFISTQAGSLAAAYERGGVEAVRLELAGVTRNEHGGVEATGRDLAGMAGSERRDELLVRLADERGETLFLYNPDNWTAAEIAKLDRETGGSGESWIQLGPAEDDDALEALVLTLSDGVRLQVGMDADIREDAMESMREAFFAIVLPVLLIALLGGAFMAYRALSPIRHLVETLHAVIDTGKISTRVPEEDVRGEFGDLVRLFNRMLGRIETLVLGMHRTLDNVAHDLRTPMTRLRGKAELALQADGDIHAYREALAESVEASESAMTMLESIMDVAEAESGVMPLRLEMVRLNDLVDDVVDVYDIVAEDKGLSIEMEVPRNLQILADRSRMRQVLANLVDNAVKYTPRGGRVRVSARQDGVGVRLDVADTGIGISPEERHLIWDRLYRGDRSRSQRGLGLGLSFVKAIIEAHGGRVDVESSEGMGSLFTVYLPTQ